MTAEEKLEIQARYEYLKRMQKRYLAASREEKSRMLDEMATYTGIHRRSISRRLHSRIERRRRGRERGETYGSEFDRAIVLIWEATDYVCAERLTSNLVMLAELLETHGELKLTPTLRRQLSQVSIATVRRHLPSMPLVHRQRKPRPPLNQYQRQIPTRIIPRDTAEPGHFEMDLVHHCGARATGEYIYTLQLIDMATGWSGRRAILGRSYVVVADALVTLRKRIPFPILELHPDNGSEFLNVNLLTFLQEHCPHIALSRSRPSFPNDNRLVEQKNHTLVRQYLGNRRLDTVTQTRFLNTIYEKLDDLYNYIQPVMRQIDKQWVPPSDSRPGYLKRIHDTPCPPLSRLCDSLHLSASKIQSLWRHRNALNPLLLRRQIYRDLDHLFAYPNAQPNSVQDIYQTIDNLDLFPEVLAALGEFDNENTSSQSKEVAVA